MDLCYPLPRWRGNLSSRGQRVAWRREKRCLRHRGNSRVPQESPRIGPPLSSSGISARASARGEPATAPVMKASGSGWRCELVIEGDVDVPKAGGGGKVTQSFTIPKRIHHLPRRRGPLSETPVEDLGKGEPQRPALLPRRSAPDARPVS